MKNKKQKVHPAISEFFRKKAKDGWVKRKKKIIQQAKIKVAGSADSENKKEN